MSVTLLVRAPRWSTAGLWWRWLAQWACGRRGHEYVRRYTRTRIWLECSHCGHETAGWTLRSMGPTRRYAGDVRRLRLERPL